VREVKVEQRDRHDSGPNQKKRKQIKMPLHDAEA
jgi:hypothetical protein